MSASGTGVLLDQLSQAAIDMLPAAVFIATVPGVEIIRINRRASLLCGNEVRPGQRLDLRLHAAPADDTPPAVPADSIARALATGERLQDVEAVLDATPQPIPISVCVEPIHTPNGAVVATLTLCQRSPHWRDVATALRRSEQRLTLALSAGRLGAWEFDLDTRTLTSSPQCKANHGLRPDDDLQLEEHVLPATDAGYRDAFRGAIERAIETAGAFEIEVPHRWPDGTDHWLLVAGRVIDPSSMVGVTLDVTERRRTEEALMAADRGKDEFLALLGHELRSPLAPILTAVKLLQMKGPADPVLQKLRDTILRQTLQLSRLVDDLLDFGGIVNGKLRLDRRIADLNPIVKQAIETSQPLIEHRGHQLVATLAESPLHADLDAARIVQVVSNLLNNAAKYMPEGGRIELTTAERDGAAVVSVRDHGVGIAPEMLDRIFQRFVRVEGMAHRGQGGLGLGLALVKAFVELHGGTVNARSAGLGKGAEFIVRLPLASSVLADLVPAESP